MKFTWRLLRCLFNKHEPGFWREAFPSRRIRICINCGKITDETSSRPIEKSARLKR